MFATSTSLASFLASPSQCHIQFAGALSPEKSLCSSSVMNAPAAVAISTFEWIVRRNCYESGILHIIECIAYLYRSTWGSRFFLLNNCVYVSTSFGGEKHVEAVSREENFESIAREESEKMKGEMKLEWCGIVEHFSRDRNCICNKGSESHSGWG